MDKAANASAKDRNREIRELAGHDRALYQLPFITGQGRDSARALADSCLSS